MLVCLRQLDKTLIKPYAICFRAEGKLKPEFEALNIPITELRLRRWNQPYILYRLVRMIRDKDIQLIHTHGYHSDIVGRLAGFIAKVPVISTLHTNSSWKRKPFTLIHHFRKWADGLTARRLGTKFIALSLSIKKFHVTALGYPEEKFSIIPNPMDVSRINILTSKRTIIRDEFGIGNDVSCILSVGNLLPIKGHTFLIDAASELRDQNKKFLMLIIGEGPCRKELEEQIRHLQLEKNVKLMGYREDVGSFLSSSDIFVMPSLSEGQSIAILEAMANGLPLVVTSQGAHTDYLKHEKSAMIVPPADKVKLTIALTKLIDDPKLRHKLASNATSSFKELGADCSIQQQQSLYMKVINGDSEF